MKNLMLISLLIGILVISACSSNKKSNSMDQLMDSVQRNSINNSVEPNENYDKEFEKFCKDRTPDNWDSMLPMVNGKFTSDVSCWGCMSDDGMTHFCDKEEYMSYLENEK